MHTSTHQNQASDDLDLWCKKTDFQEGRNKPLKSGGALQCNQTKFKWKFVPLSQKTGGARAPLAPPVPTTLFKRVEHKVKESMTINTPIIFFFWTPFCADDLNSLHDIYLLKIPSRFHTCRGPICIGVMGHITLALGWLLQHSYFPKLWMIPLIYLVIFLLNT